MKNVKKLIAFMLSIMLIFALASCGKTETENTENSNKNSETLTKIQLCLDWTPNTNHTGLFVALEKGYYKEAGLDVSIIQPPENGATEACSAGQVQFAIDFQDTLTPAFTSDTPMNVTAIAAILQHNTSGIISKKGEGMYRPAGLEGKEFLTWNVPTELAIMENVVTNDGGDWDKVKLIPNTVTDEAQDVMANPSHAIWVFYGWSAINAQTNNIETDFFFFKDLNPVFDYYSPVIIGNNDFLKNNPETVKAFLEATKKGYEFAIENPEEAAQILIDSDDTGSLIGNEELVIESQKWLSEQYIADADKWGYISPVRWDGFYEWLYTENLIDSRLPAGTGYTNEFLS